MRAIAILLAMAVAGCAPGAAEAPDEHTAKRATDLIVEEALAADPPDYARAITALQRSGRPSGTIALETGDLIVAGHREERRERRPSASLDQGLALLEQAASSRGEAADIAPQHLRLWFERGVGSGSTRTMRPLPELAHCWAAVEEREQRRSACIRLRAGAR